MKKLARIIGLALTSTFLFVACSTKEKTETNQVTKDSVLSSDLIPTPSQAGQASEDASDFGKFIQLFNSPGTEISPELLSALSISNEVGGYTSREILENDSIIFVLFNHMKPVGPGVDELHAATFSKDGTFIVEVLIGSSYPSSGPDGGGEDYHYRYDTNRKILQVTNSTIEWDENAQ
jgi:hypothetical protein